NQKLVPLLDVLKGSILETVLCQGLTRLVNMDRLGEFELHRCSAGEIDPHVGRAASHLDHSNEAGYRDNTGDDEGDLPHSDEIYVCFSYKFHGSPYMLILFTFMRLSAKSKTTLVATREVKRLMMIPRLKETAK